MYFTCPHCNKAIQIQPEQSGQIVDCDHCGAVVEVPYRISGSNRDNYLRILNESAKGRTQSVESPSHDKLYFVLGLLFSLLGVLISSVVGGQRGLRESFRGLLCGFGVYVLCHLVSLILFKMSS